MKNAKLILFGGLALSALLAIIKSIFGWVPVIWIMILVLGTISVLTTWGEIQKGGPKGAAAALRLLAYAFLLFFFGGWLIPLASSAITTVGKAGDGVSWVINETGNALSAGDACADLTSELIKLETTEGRQEQFQKLKAERQGRFFLWRWLYPHITTHHVTEYINDRQDLLTQIHAESPTACSTGTAVEQGWEAGKEGAQRVWNGAQWLWKEGGGFIDDIRNGTRSRESVNTRRSERGNNRNKRDTAPEVETPKAAKKDDWSDF